MEKEEIYKIPKTQAETNAEYWAALEKWMDNVRSISVTCKLLSNLTFPMMMTGPSISPSMAPPFNMPAAPPMLFALNNNNLNPNANPVPNITQTPVNGPAPVQTEFVEYRIPPLWKRFAAESLDFLFLFILKLTTMFIAVDFSEVKNLEKYISVLQNDDKVDYNLAIEMTTELLVLELIHRIVVCAYEGYMIAQPGGATPGKWVMGLRVVSCTLVVPGPTPNTVRVTPGATLSLGYSVLRAVLKNLVIGFLLPVCLPLFFYKFNRCGYDHVSRCIVVEDNRPALRPR